MDTAELIRQVMNEVMANLDLDKDPVAPAAAAGRGAAADAGRVDASQYPLGEKAPERIRAANGRPLSEFSFEKLKSGELQAEDFRIAPQTLELQAQVAESAGRDALARNMRRAAELIAVPDDELLEVYGALRPYRSTKA